MFNLKNEYLFIEIDEIIYNKDVIKMLIVIYFCYFYFRKIINFVFLFVYVNEYKYINVKEKKNVVWYVGYFIIRIVV